MTYVHIITFQRRAPRNFAENSEDAHDLLHHGPHVGNAVGIIILLL